MIHRAKFQNFKALRDVEVPFDSRLTVLVGPNGSGKTSVLQGIQFIGRYALAGPPDYFSFQTLRGEARMLYGWQAVPAMLFLFDEDALLGARIEVVDETDPTNVVMCNYSGSASPDRRSGPGNPAIPPVRHEISITEHGRRIAGDGPRLHQIRSATLLRLDPSQLAAPSLPIFLPPKIGPDGTGLPSTLAYLLRKYPEQFEEITHALRSVIPNVVRVRLDLERLGGNFGDVILFDFKGAKGVNASSVSDGTLFVLGLLTVILYPERPQLLLLDDLDHRLHPKAQMNLVDLLRRILDQFPDLQIVATSHSPYILDRLEPNEVRVTGLRDDGQAVVARLEDAPDFERWRDAMTPGEFWSHMGDDWVKTVPKQPVAPVAP